MSAAFAARHRPGRAARSGGTVPGAGGRFRGRRSRVPGSTELPWCLLPPEVVGAGRRCRTSTRDAVDVQRWRRPDRGSSEAPGPAQACFGPYRRGRARRGGPPPPRRPPSGTRRSRPEYLPTPAGIRPDPGGGPDAGRGSRAPGGTARRPPRPGFGRGRSSRGSGEGARSGDRPRLGEHPVPLRGQAEPDFGGTVGRLEDRLEHGGRVDRDVEGREHRLQLHRHVRHREEEPGAHPSQPEGLREGSQDDDASDSLGRADAGRCRRTGSRPRRRPGSSRVPWPSRPPGRTSGTGKTAPVGAWGVATNTTPGAPWSISRTSSVHRKSEVRPQGHRRVRRTGHPRGSLVERERRRGVEDPVRRLGQREDEEVRTGRDDDPLLGPVQESGDAAPGHPPRACPGIGSTVRGASAPAHDS